MKNFLFTYEILPPLSAFFCVCIFPWENLSIYTSQYVLQGLTQERGIPPVPTSSSPSDLFVLMNQMSPSYWLYVGNCFMILQQRDKEEDMTFLNRLLSSADPTPAPCWHQNSCFVDMSPGRKWYSVVFSNSISGIHSGGSPLVHYY